MHKIGIMQGRLSPVQNGKIQEFPVGSWREEFPLAQECGFDLMEWVLDLEHLGSNPLFSASGRQEMKELQEEYSVKVPIICVDYFMERSFFDPDILIRAEGIGIFFELIRECPSVGIHQIEVPLLGNCCIEEAETELLLLELIDKLVPSICSSHLEIIFEVSIQPIRVRDFLSKIRTSQVKINYDTGNSAYWGFNVDHEFSMYGERIGNIHIKDCTPEEYSVPLGRGNVDFDQTFRWIRDISYSGDFILQAARGEDDIETAKAYLEFTRRLIEKHLNPD